MAHALPIAPTVLCHARVGLAACFRAASRLGLHKGICNRLPAMVQGSASPSPVNPYEGGFHEITASRLLNCDCNGNVVAGAGAPEATAFHTHMPNATALAMLEGESLAYAGMRNTGDEPARLHLESIKRTLDREAPDYRH